MAITIAPRRPSRWQDAARHRAGRQSSLRTWRPGSGPAHARLADRSSTQPWATPLAFSMPPVDVEPPPRRPAVTPDDRHAWNSMATAALLLCHRCRSEEGADRAPADARSSFAAIVSLALAETPASAAAG